MSDGLKLDRSALRCVGAALVTGVLATGLVLYFLARADLAMVLLVMCVSLPAVTLLVLVGYLLRGSPQRRGYLIPLKALALVSVGMSVMMVLDLLLPTRTRAAAVTAKVLNDRDCVLCVGRYQQPVEAAMYDSVLEGDVVLIEATPLFKRVEALSTPRAPGRPEMVGYRRPLWDALAMLGAALLFFLPVGLVPFSPSPQDGLRNMRMYFLLVVPSYVFSLVAAGMWIKLLLLHAG